MPIQKWNVTPRDTEAESRGASFIMDKYGVGRVLAKVMFLFHSCVNNVGPLQRVNRSKFYVCQKCNDIVGANGGWGEGERSRSQLF